MSNRNAREIEVGMSCGAFDRIKAFHLVRTCVVIGDASPHTQSSMHADMHSAGNDTETTENDSRNVIMCQIERMMQNIPDMHEIMSPKHAS